MNNLVKQRITAWLMFLHNKEATLDPNNPVDNTVNLLYTWEPNLLDDSYDALISYIELENTRIKNL